MFLGRGGSYRFKLIMSFCQIMYILNLELRKVAPSGHFNCK